MAVDPDSFVQEHGIEAMADLIDFAIPLRTKMVHDVLVKGIVWDRSVLESGPRLVERDLLETAGGLLAMVADLRAGARLEVEDRSADLQRAAIALAARGAVPVARLERVPAEAFTGAARLFAWVLASKICGMFGRRASFHAVRYARVVAPRPDLPIEVWQELNHETDEELDAAEAMAAIPEALALLVADHRMRLARAWLAPVLAGIDRGEPMADTAARLRQAADIFEGRV